MSLIYYKFKSAKDFDTLPVDGIGLSVFDIKREIMLGKRLGKGLDFDLALYNAQTNEEYDDDAYVIPRNTSVLVARKPAQKVGKGSAQRYLAAQVMIPQGRGRGGPQVGAQGVYMKPIAQATGAVGAKQGGGKEDGRGSGDLASAWVRESLGALARELIFGLKDPGGIIGCIADLTDDRDVDDKSGETVDFKTNLNPLTHELLSRSRQALSNQHQRAWLIGTWDDRQSRQNAHFLHCSPITDTSVAESQAISNMFKQQAEQWQQTQDQMQNVKPIFRPFAGAGRGGGNPQNPIRPYYPQEDTRPPPPGYTCFRCGEKGHYINSCPTLGDPDFENKPKIKKATGIPTMFLKTIKKEGTERDKGLMVTGEGDLVVAMPNEDQWRKMTAARGLGMKSVYDMGEEEEGGEAASGRGNEGDKKRKQ